MQNADHEADSGTPGHRSSGTATRRSRYLGSGVETASSGEAGRAARTQDPIEAGALIAASYGGGEFFVAPLTDDFLFRQASLGTPEVSLHSLECPGEVTGNVPFYSRYAVTWFVAGTGSMTVNRVTRHTVSSEPIMVPTERAFDLVLRPTRQNIVHFAPEFLEDLATEVHGGDRRALAFDLAAAAAPQAMDRWRNALTGATAAARDSATTPLVRSNAERALGHALLALFAWSAWPVPAEMRTPPAWRVRAALDHLHHHAAEPVTPADAARAAGLHTRTLQQATQRYLGISPTAYLRAVRLERAHRELVVGDPGSETVAAIAGRWGFGNLGRFAAAYRDVYGERPNETLRHWR